MGSSRYRKGRIWVRYPWSRALAGRLLWEDNFYRGIQRHIWCGISGILWCLWSYNGSWAAKGIFCRRFSEVLYRSGDFSGKLPAAVFPYTIHFSCIGRGGVDHAIDHTGLRVAHLASRETIPGTSCKGSPGASGKYYRFCRGNRPRRKNIIPGKIYPGISVFAPRSL